MINDQLSVVNDQWFDQLSVINDQWSQCNGSNVPRGQVWVSSLKLWSWHWSLPINITKFFPVGNFFLLSSGGNLTNWKELICPTTWCPFSPRGWARMMMMIMLWLTFLHSQRFCFEWLGVLFVNVAKCQLLEFGREAKLAKAASFQPLSFSLSFSTILSCSNFFCFGNLLQ